MARFKDLNASLYYRNLDIKKVYVPVEYGDTICGLLFTPKNVESTKLPTIIAHHGFTGNKEGLTTGGYTSDGMGICESLANAGHVVFVYDQRGTGESTGEVVFEQVIKDIDTIIDFVKTLPFVDPDRVGITGHSLGGYLTCISSGLYKDKIKASAALAAPSDLKSIIQDIIDSLKDTLKKRNAQPKVQGFDIYDTLFKTIELMENILERPQDFNDNMVKKLFTPLGINFEIAIHSKSKIIPLLNPNCSLFFGSDGVYIKLGNLKGSLGNYLTIANTLTSLNSTDMVAKAAPNPILFIQGNMDEVVPPNSINILYDSASDPKYKVIVPNTNHGFVAPVDQRKMVQDTLVDFFTKNL